MQNMQSQGNLGLIDRVLGYVSRNDRPFFFLPLVLVVVVEVFYKLGPLDLQQVLNFLTFHR